MSGWTLKLEPLEDDICHGMHLPEFIGSLYDCWIQPFSKQVPKSPNFLFCGYSILYLKGS